MSRPPRDRRVDLIEPPRDAPPVFLRRGNARPEGDAVLLLHGASASCDTFLEPREGSVFDYLTNVRERDVWMLDWRGSFYNADEDPDDRGTIDDVAASDIPYAIRYIRETRAREALRRPPTSAPRDPRLTVLGHCLGSAALAMAVGGGHVQPADVKRIIFSTVGLFYEVTWDGWTKVQDRILEQVADQDPDYAVIGPDVHVTRWPPAMERTYGIWPKTWGPPWGEDAGELDGDEAERSRDFFRRLSFLFGQCFLVSNLHEAMTRAAVRRQFGSVPFRVYRHAAQNALRGFAAPFDAEGRLQNPDTPNGRIAATVAETYVNLERFAPFDITLVTGADNPLWHRDSTDRMGEWLARLGRPPEKLVFDGYGHQDLWWGRNSWREVFPLVF